MRISRSALAAACTAVALAGLLAPAQASAVTPSRAGEVVRLSMRDAVASLPVVEEDRTGYKRTSFKHWVDADHDGCNTRQEVLLQEALTPPAQGPGCKLTGGVWFSEYDNTNISGASGLDIDHLVPLSEAWDSGASAWSGAEREAYANDLGDPRSLVAVSARTNRSKADQDPSTWLPPYAGDVCPYVGGWVAVKVRWGLSIDPAEKVTIDGAETRCHLGPIDVTRAR